MEYSVPQHIDSNKIFLVNFSELEGRWDPYFYKPDFSVFHNQIKNQKYVRFGSVIKKITNGLDCRNYTKTGTVYLKVANVKKGELSLDDVQYVDICAEGITKSIQLTEGNLLLTRKGTFGNTYCIKQNQDYIISSEIFYITINQNLINGDFLAIVLNSRIGQIQFDRNKIGAIMGSLSQKVVKDILIPIPSKKIQQQIIDKYNAALQSCRIKLALAKQKLASIDEYLLCELGFTLPKDDFQELKDRMFTVRFKEVVGNRFDPFYYLVSGKKVTSTSFANTQLKDIANIVKGISITSDAVNKNGQYPVIAGGQTSPYNHDQYNFGGNVITISASGAYSGYVWYHEKPIFASDCSVIYSKDEKKFLTRYIFEVLKVQQQQIYNLQQGAGQPHVYPEDLGKLIIPEVSLEKQKEIVAHISAIRADAKSLENEAEEVLSKAREEVEQMILNKA